MTSRSRAMESLEPRRLLTADLSWGLITTTGELFSRGGIAIVKAYVRNFGDQHVVAPFAVQFKYKNVGFSNDDLEFDDPLASSLTTTPVTTPIPISSVGVQLSFPLTFPADLPAGRYALVAMLDPADGLMETREDNNEKMLGFGQALPADGNLVVNGLETADSIIITTATKDKLPAYSVSMNGVTDLVDAAKVTAFSVNALGGDDTVVATGAIPNLRIDAGDGYDRVAGGDLNDTLIGGAGKDILDGGAGNDRLNGNGGHDRLFGSAGSDRLYGYAGNDYLDGGSSGDRLEGGAGLDTMLGQSGNDRFFAQDGEIDQVYGGGGTDTGAVDPSDILGSIENRA